MRVANHGSGSPSFRSSHIRVARVRRETRQERWEGLGCGQRCHWLLALTGDPLGSESGTSIQDPQPDLGTVDRDSHIITSRRSTAGLFKPGVPIPSLDPAPSCCSSAHGRYCVVCPTHTLHELAAWGGRVLHAQWWCTPDSPHRPPSSLKPGFINRAIRGLHNSLPFAVPEILRFLIIIREHASSFSPTRPICPQPATSSHFWAASAATPSQGNCRQRPFSFSQHGQDRRPVLASRRDGCRSYQAA